MEQVDQQRAATQVARADDQVVLAVLREQLEATCTKALTATRQRIQANNYAALAEVARNRAEALTVKQDRVERDLHQHLAQTQNVVADLQHEVDYLNNRLYPILDWEEDGPVREEEEEDPKMFVEYDGWEEEEQMVPMYEDDVISDLDSDHADE